MGRFLHRSLECHLQPSPFSRRARNRFDEPLNSQTRPEAERLLNFSRDRANESRHLDRLEIVEAQLMGRGNAELAVRRVVRSGLDTAKTLPPRPTIDRIPVQLVQALLAEGKRAARAPDLKIMLHLATGGDPIRLNRPRRAILKAQEYPCRIIDGDGSCAARRDRTFQDRDDAIAHDL